MCVYAFFASEFRFSSANILTSSSLHFENISHWMCDDYSANSICTHTNWKPSEMAGSQAREQPQFFLSFFFFIFFIYRHHERENIMGGMRLILIFFTYIFYFFSTFFLLIHGLYKWIRFVYRKSLDNLHNKLLPHTILKEIANFIQNWKAAYTISIEILCTFIVIYSFGSLWFETLHSH